MPAVFIPDRDQSPSPTLFPLTILRSFFFSLSSSSFPHALFVSFHIPNKKFAHYRLARGERALFKVFKDVALLQIRDSIELSLSLSLSLSMNPFRCDVSVFSRLYFPVFSLFFYSLSAVLAGDCDVLYNGGGRTIILGRWVGVVVFLFYFLVRYSWLVRRTLLSQLSSVLTGLSSKYFFNAFLIDLMPLIDSTN